MPFVRISLRKGFSPEVKDHISEAVHQSLISEFNIPKDDYFHLIEELDVEQIKYPSTYLGISHTNDIVFVQIMAGVGRTVQQKERLYACIAESISTTTNIKKDNIIIVLMESSVDNWSFGQGKKQLFPHMQASSVEREDLLTAQLGDHRNVSRVEIKKVVIPPGGKAGRHLHPCPVVGHVVSGKLLFQTEDGERLIMNKGEAFYEPKDQPILHFDNASDAEPLVFIAYYLVDDKEDLITML